jgi:hypothetical protein
MARRGEITGRKPRATADRAKRCQVPRTDSSNVETDSDAVESVTRSESGENECTTAPPIRGPPVPPALFTISSFCAAHLISEAFYFKLKNLGLGPNEMHLGSRVFITFEAASAWRKAREKATPRVKPSPSPEAA